MFPAQFSRESFAQALRELDGGVSKDGAFRATLNKTNPA